MVLNRLRSLHAALVSSPFWKHSFVYFCGNVINAVLPLLLMPLFTRYLSPTDYGILGTSGILVQFLTMAIGLNSSGLIVGSQFEGSREAQRQLVSTNLFVSAALAAFLSLCTLVAGELFQRVTKFPAPWAPAVVVLALAGVIRAMYLCLLQARNEAGRFVGLQVLTTGSNLVLSVVLIVAAGMRWQGRMLAMLASGALVAVISLYGLITRLKVLVPAFDQKALKSLLAFGVPLIPHALGGSVVTVAPTLYLNHLATVADTGLYSLGFRIASPVALVAGAANQAYMPALFSKLSRPESLDKLQLCRVLLRGSAGLIAAGLAYGFGARLFLPLLVGPRFYEAADYVLWLALAFAIHGAYFVFTNFVVYAKRTALIAWRADFLAGIAILVLTPWFIRLNGPIGAAQATCLAFAISCVGSFTASRRAYSMPWAGAALSFARSLEQRPVE